IQNSMLPCRPIAAGSKPSDTGHKKLRGLSRKNGPTFHTLVIKVFNAISACETPLNPLSSPDKIWSRAGVMPRNLVFLIDPAGPGMACYRAHSIAFKHQIGQELFQWRRT